MILTVWREGAFVVCGVEFPREAPAEPAEPKPAEEEV
jgi:hypothetical protein